MLMTPTNDLGFDVRTEQSQTDRLTGFGSRRKLIADLTAALEPESPPSVLAVFDLAGSEDYRLVFGEPASDTLIVRLAEQFARIVEADGRCYRPRQDEFCTLVDLPIGSVATMLAAVAASLGEEGESFLITTSFGVALLPDEAGEPIEALMVADQNLDIARNGRERRNKRSQDARLH
jgi:GGDEF domain-containing protein